MVDSVGQELLDGCLNRISRSLLAKVTEHHGRRENLGHRIRNRDIAKCCV